ncbi:MAG: hypothetical protein J5669_02770 [Bacteroidales bacterium]|nr:hypothetical protein [Bacteroidales bacterium]
MKKVVLVLALVLVSLAGFAQKRTTSVEVDYMEASARYLEPAQSVIAIPLVADLKVLGGQITYTEKEAFKDYPVTEDLVSLMPNFKKIALCRAARHYKADMIIGATVDIVTNADGRLEITIIGYPAVYSNFRNATAEDLDIARKASLVGTGKADAILGKADNLKVEEEIHVKND